MSSTVEADNDMSVSDFNIGWGVKEVPEEVPCLGVTISSHSLGQAPVEPAGDDEEDHVKVNLQAHG